MPPDVANHVAAVALSRWTNTGWLGGAAGEHHLDVGARLRVRGWDGCTRQDPTCHRHSTNQNADLVSPHSVMLTYRDVDGDRKDQRPMNAA